MILAHVGEELLWDEIGQIDRELYFCESRCKKGTKRHQSLVDMRANLNNIGVAFQKMAAEIRARFSPGEGDVYAPNAADAEAYRAVTLEDAKIVRDKYLDELIDHEDAKGGVDGLTTDQRVVVMLVALQSIGAVIPTAAPVPADEGEKK